MATTFDFGLGKVLPSIVIVSLCLLGVQLLWTLVFREFRRMRIRKAGFDPRMGPKDFVDWTALVFRDHGYKVEVTEGLNDKGADLVLKKDSETIVVQVKHWRKAVGMSAVREIVASKPYYKADRCAVVCSSTYTKRAVELAKVNRVQLYNLDRLLKMAPDSSATKDVK